MKVTDHENSSSGKDSVSREKLDDWQRRDAAKRKELESPPNKKKSNDIGKQAEG